MKKHYIFSIIVCAALMLSGCSENSVGSAVTSDTGGAAASTEEAVKTPAAVTGTPVLPEPLPDDGRIFLINEYSNYAWGFQDNGVFLDTNGDVYRFEFGKNGGTGDMTFGEMLGLFKKNTSPICHLDEDTVAELYNIGKAVDPQAGMSEKGIMNDYGQRTLYFYDSENDRKVPCYSYGDIERISNDSNARLFREKWEGSGDSYSKKVSDIGIVNYVPMDETTLIELPSDGLKTEGRYILFDKRQLSVLAENCGAAVDSILDVLNKYLADDAVFFVSLTKSSPSACGMMRKDDSYDLIYPSDEMKPVCHVAAFPREAGDFQKLIYTDFSGEQWQTVPDFDPNSDSRVHGGYSYGVSDDAISKIYKEYKINNLWGILIQNTEDYESLVSYCGNIGLMEDGSSVKELFECAMKPDFDSYVLCVKLQRRERDQTYEQHRICIVNNYIDIGDSIVPKIDINTQSVDGAVAWLWLPVDYLDKDKNYMVK